jgi:cytochrome c6
MLNGDCRLGGAIIKASRRILAGLLLSLVCNQALYAADPFTGGKLYQSHCLNCHGASGAGEIPNIPDFSRGESLLQPDNTLLETIKSGKGMMPAFRGIFTDDEIRDVIAYVRTLRR